MPGLKLELFVISFEQDKLTLRVPTAKIKSVGMRKLAEEDWSRRRSTPSPAAPASSAPCGRAAPRNTKPRSIRAT